MDREANEVFYEGNDTTVFAGSVDVIPDIDVDPVGAWALANPDFVEQV
ncbi:hypothetical protein IOC57_07135 [Bacillus sp. SD075]|nr:hypothetical protein [Bacillus sp. SD075]MBO0997522.1 hypothetical protein [Bacillus sp. SD075]